MSKQHLYRHFDKNGKLLYVGVSTSALKRLAEHKQSSHWYYEITNVTIENFDSRDAVLKAEREAIIKEKPLHNLMRPSIEQTRKFERIAAEESRAAILKRIVSFDPVYTIRNTAKTLCMSEGKIKDLIKSNKIGHVCISERFVKGKAIKSFVITGWQIIEFLEHAQQAGGISKPEA